MQILQEIANVISYVSLGIIAYGALFAIFEFIRNEFGRFTGKFAIKNLSVIRQNFGYYLLVGLEFLIASDVIHTILDPNFNDLIVLGGIVLIRTVLTFFLNREVRQGTVVQKDNDRDKSTN